MKKRPLYLLAIAGLGALTVAADGDSASGKKEDESRVRDNQRREATEKKADEVRQAHSHIIGAMPETAPIKAEDILPTIPIKKLSIVKPHRSSVYPTIIEKPRSALTPIPRSSPAELLPLHLRTHGAETAALNPVAPVKDKASTAALDGASIKRKP